MKAFKKWIKQRKEQNEEAATALAETGMIKIVNMVAEATWRATLEWILSTQTNIGYSVPVILVDVIEKELEEEE